MKKIYFVLLSLALVFCLGGCQLLGRRTTTEEPTTVVTKGAPTINGAHDVELELNERYIPMAGISAVDADGNDITDDVVYTGDVDYTKVGEYHATFTVTDSNGKTTSVTITVRVVSSDKEAPALSGVADIEIPVTSDFDPMQGVSAIDTTDGDLTDKVQVEGKVDTKNLGTQTLKYSVVDNAGNKAELNRVVKVTEGRFVFEEEAASSENKVTCDPLDLEGVYTFVLIKVKYSVAEAGDVTVALGDYSVSHHHDAAGEFIAYVRADEALTDQAISLTGATFVSLWIGSCPDVTAPTITGNFSQTFVISKDNRDLAAQFVADMSEAVARDDTDGFITKDCYMEFPEGFSWDSTDEQDAFFCAKDKAGNVARKEVKVIVAAATKLADMLPVGEGPDSEHDNNPQILMYRNMTMTKQADGSILLSEMASGGYASFQMIKYDLSNLSYGNTYMLKLTAKFLPGESTQETQAVGYRIGQSLGADPWYAEFSGFSYDYFNLTPELTTTYHVFKYDMTPEAASAFGDVSGEAMEFQFGNTTWHSIYDVVLVSFELYILSNENQAPTLIRNTELPTILVKGSEAPDLAAYYSYFDVEDKDLEIVIEGTVDMTTKGVYPVKYTVTDSEGLKAEATINFEVLNEADTIAPEIKWESPDPETLPALPEEIKVDAYSTDAVKNFFLQGLKITDKKDGATIEMAVKDASINWGGLDMSKPGKYTIKVTATDDSGNKGTFSFAIKVIKEQQEGPMEFDLVRDLMPNAEGEGHTIEKVDVVVEEGIAKINPNDMANQWYSNNKLKYTLTSNLEAGKTYRFKIVAKADEARKIIVSLGGNYWPDNENLAKLECALGIDFEEFTVDFEYTGKTPTDKVVTAAELELQFGKGGGEGETPENSVYVKSFALYEVIGKAVQQPEQPEEPTEVEDPEGCLVNALKATAYSDGGAGEMKKNADGSYSVQAIKEKWFGWKDFTLTAEAKYLVIVIDANISIRYKMDNAGNSYDTKAKKVKEFNGEETIVYPIAEVTSNPTEIKKVVLWGLDDSNPTITVKALYFTATDPTAAGEQPETPETPEEPEQPETPAEPTSANLKLDFQDGNVGSLYTSAKWAQEKYNWDAATQTGEWVPMSAGQMYSKEKDGAKVVNMKGFQGLTSRYTYSDGASLGLANCLSLKIGNYYSGVEIDMKIVLLDKEGNSVYLVGGQNTFVKMPVTSGLQEQTIVFPRMEVAGIRFVIGNVTKSEGVYVYIDDVELKDIAMEEAYEATVGGQKVVLSSIGNTQFGELSCAALGLKLVVEVETHATRVQIKDASQNGAYLTLNGTPDEDHKFTITSAEGSFTYKDLFVNAVFAPIAKEAA